VRVIGGADIDGIDIRSFQQASPVGFYGFILPLVSELPQLFFAASADGFQDGTVTQLGEEVVDSLVAIGMRTAHEAIPNHADIQRFQLRHRGDFQENR